MNNYKHSAALEAVKRLKEKAEKYDRQQIEIKQQKEKIELLTLRMHLKNSSFFSFVSPA